MNLISVMDMCRVMAPLLAASPVASLVNIGSIKGVVASTREGGSEEPGHAV